MSLVGFRKINEDTGWICPVCGRSIAPNLMSCPYCKGKKNINTVTCGISSNEQLICDSDNLTESEKFGDYLENDKMINERKH